MAFSTKSVGTFLDVAWSRYLFCFPTRHPYFHILYCTSVRMHLDFSTISRQFRLYRRTEIRALPLITHQSITHTIPSPDHLPKIIRPVKELSIWNFLLLYCARIVSRNVFCQSGRSREAIQYPGDQRSLLQYYRHERQFHKYVYKL